MDPHEIPVSPLLNVSAIVPRPGTAEYEYQLAHWDDNVRPQSIAGCAVVMAVSTIVVAMRMLSQRYFAKGWAVTDWLVFVSWIISIGIGVESIVSYVQGFGVHQLRVILSDPSPPNSLVSAFENGSFASYAWVPALACVKISLLIYYNQLFLVQQRWLKILLWVMGVYVVAWTIGSLFPLIFQCSPVPYFWERMSLFYGIVTEAATNGSCLPQLPKLATPSVTNVFSDVVIILIPILVLPRLTMNRTKKIGLVLLFSLGWFDIASGCVRVYYVFKVSNDTDVTWNDIGTVVWTVVETNIAIVCASIPPCMPLFIALYKRSGLGGESGNRNEQPRRWNLFRRRRQHDTEDEVARWNAFPAFGSRRYKPAKTLNTEDNLYRNAMRGKWTSHSHSHSHSAEYPEPKTSDLESGFPMETVTDYAPPNVGSGTQTSHTDMTRSLASDAGSGERFLRDDSNKGPAEASMQRFR